LERGKRNNQRGERKTVSAEQHDRNEIRSEVGRSSGVSAQKDVSNTDSKRGCLRKTSRENAKNVRESSRHKREYGRGVEKRKLKSWIRRVDDGIPSQLDSFEGWEVEPEDIPRVEIGVKDRTDRLKSLGNSIVPQVVAEIFKAIKETENEG
jgi:DNA (cytosine-5)-methyltransferase 1